MSAVSEYLYLEIAAGNVYLQDYDNEEEVAELVIALICDNGNEWVRLRTSGHDHWSTEWTVLERNSGNMPTQVGCREFDGSMEIISTEVT